MTVSPSHQVRMYTRWKPQFYDGLAANNKWKHIGEIVEFGEINRQFEILRFQAANRRYAVKAKGVKDINDVTMRLGFSYEDDGQVILRQAIDLDYDFHFVIHLRDFTVYDEGGASFRRKWTSILFRALVTQYGVVPGNSSTFVMANLGLAVLPHSFVLYQHDVPSNVFPKIAYVEENTESQHLLEEPYQDDQPPIEDEVLDAG